ncbi:HutD family protein [Achromobacter sp. NFACC18-2]|uniref:HutD/Ves family protein n=1 Tax=Achromobacter sp. NFACC18-2 TaxID=1564112 RepID=UPI0008CE9F0B|nr:HutD family protein [Achromobacter sp. NFACC18-2]SEK10586.1 HutD protein [Achromobacter sp. NFACC18-2]
MARSPDPRAPVRASWLALPPEPWKNGGGVTRTLAADPAGRWRVSIADIGQDGPYSRFPGYDRVSVVLSGEGVALQGEGVAVALRPRSPTVFAGDEVLQSRLVRGPVRVLNLFVLRGSAEARVECAAGPACRAGSLAGAGGRRVTRIVVAVDAGRFPGAPGGAPWVLDGGDYAWDADIGAAWGAAWDSAWAPASEADPMAPPGPACAPAPDAPFAVGLDIAVHAHGAG